MLRRALHRTATTLRWALAAVAVLLLAWWPVSYWVGARAVWPQRLRLTLASGFVTAIYTTNPGNTRVPPEARLFLLNTGNRWDRLLDQRGVLPTFTESNIPGIYAESAVTVPFWQLALAAAAWPGASLIARNRRRRRDARGFAVVGAD